MDFIKGFNRYQLIMMDFEFCAGLDSWARIIDLFPLGFKDILSTEWIKSLR